MNVYSVYDDYEVWLTTDVVLRELGIQIDHQWRDWYLGKLRVFKLINTNDVIENRTKYVYSTGSRHFFDDGLEERLGGEKQTLGAGL